MVAGRCTLKEKTLTTINCRNVVVFIHPNSTWMKMDMHDFLGQLNLFANLVMLIFTLMLALTLFLSCRSPTLYFHLSCSHLSHQLMASCSCTSGWPPLSLLHLFHFIFFFVEAPSSSSSPSTSFRRRLRDRPCSRSNCHKMDKSKHKHHHLLHWLLPVQLASFSLSAVLLR